MLCEEQWLETVQLLPTSVVKRGIVAQPSRFYCIFGSGSEKKKFGPKLAPDECLFCCYKTAYRYL